MRNLAMYYQAGYTDREIAKALNCTPKYVWNWRVTSYLQQGGYKLPCKVTVDKELAEQLCRGLGL